MDCGCHHTEHATILCAEHWAAFIELMGEPLPALEAVTRRQRAVQESIDRD